MSFSVPSSPAVSRTKAQPFTPQRPIHKHQPRSQSLYKSPLTPSTSPYTPISLRSINSTGSSTLTTPDNSGINFRKRIAFATCSPEVVRNTNASKDKSLADIAENWRARIATNAKTPYVLQDDSSYVADESSDMSLSDPANDSNIFSNDKPELLEAPFLSTHKRLHSVPTFTNRPRAHSYTSTSSRLQPTSPASRKVNITTHTSSPAGQRLTTHNITTGLMTTPPPNRSLSRQLKVKGSLTDPPQPRRREALGIVNIPPHNASASMTLEPNTSLNLFDIDENDFEYEHDYQDHEVENSFSQDLDARRQNSFAYPTFAPPSLHQVQPQMFGQPAFSDPFHPGGNMNEVSNNHTLNGIGESIEHHFHSAHQQSQHHYFEDMQQSLAAFYNPLASRMPTHFNQVMHQPFHTPAFVPVHNLIMPRSASPISRQRRYQPSGCNPNTVAAAVNPTDCSVCLAIRPSTLAILQPCGHPLCSACLTSALNIVGEKDMECAVCKQGVSDFKLVMGTSKFDSSSKFGSEGSNGAISESGENKSSQQLFVPSPLSSSSFDDNGDLQSAFDLGLEFGELRASTPKIEQHIEQSLSFDSFANKKGNINRNAENVVLRIDNVPWDITPSQISKWLQQPVERVHVLLDNKGKTLSHAYVEVKNAATAGAILRGEAASPLGKKERGSVLGRGRRARGVTITRSGQPELMKDLFPHWCGNFDGSHPSLAGLDDSRAIGALEAGLLTENEMIGLSRLIREPDSHFLKVPCLPFHSLISLLIKLPTDVDSRVFWSTAVRDMLADATHTALQILIGRVAEAKNAMNKFLHEEYTLDLVIDLFHCALYCKAFTPQQLRRLVELAEANSLPLPSTTVSHPSEVAPTASFTSSTSVSVENAILSVNPKVQSAPSDTDGSLEELAKEFGVDAQVVQALAQRLAKLC